jgi:hypothetical protein
MTLLQLGSFDGGSLAGTGRVEEDGAASAASWHVEVLVQKQLRIFVAVL